MYRKISVEIDERSIVFEKNKLVAILNPGIYRKFTVFKDTMIFKIKADKTVNIEKAVVRWIEEYPTVFKDYIVEIRVKNDEFGLIYEDDLLIEILGPAQKIYRWKTNTVLDIRKCETKNEIKVSDELVKSLIEAQKNNTILGIEKAITVVEVKENHEALITVDGKIFEKVGPGVYAYWRFNKHVVAYIVDNRLQNIESVGQEILTKDKVSIRTNLSANYLVTDIEKVFASFPSYKDYIYKELQFALREVCGLLTLEEILITKDEVKNTVTTQVVDATKEYGLDVKTVAIKDIILPGDMKEILNKVVEAQKVAEANNIKRREETAATRSLHNTAKMLDKNPTLMRLKELEVLEKVTDKIDKITVSNGLDGILKDLIKIDQ